MACRDIRVSAASSIRKERGLFPGVLQVTMLVIGLCLYPQPSSSGIFDMFSFFTKKRPPAPTTVQPALEAELIKEDSLPDSRQSLSIEDLPLRCQEVGVKGKQVFFSSDPAIHETPKSGYLVEGKDIQNPFLFVNNSELGPEKNVWFELWTVETGKDYTLKNKLEFAQFEPAPNPENFYGIKVMGVGCLPNRQLLVVIGYWKPGAAFALYRFDIDRLSFTFIHDLISHNLQFEYFVQKQLDRENALALYYSDSRYQAAELYFNYYNLFLLFTPAHPEGIEILKLGIDIGNVDEWKVIDKRLFIEAVDARDSSREKESKISYWSLDLSKLL